MLRRSVVGALALAVPALWTGGPVQAQTDTRLTTCPSEAEVRASIEKWSVNYNVGVFRTKAVDGFRFGPMAFGDISKVLVSVGEEPRDTCPVRLAYDHQRGRQPGGPELGRDGPLFLSEPLQRMGLPDRRQLSSRGRGGPTVDRGEPAVLY